jgi:outer membrane protein assembly factor BamB
MGRLIVYDWSNSQDYRLRNLVCLDSSGNVAWTAALPENTGPDCFTGVTVEGDTIRANTWSSYALTLDPRTGKTLSTLFIK